MATDNYSFPTIDPSAPFDGANDINALASKIDATMKQVETLGKSAQYELPTATSTRLGGVRIGSNINVASDGTISTQVDPYVLPPASRTTLGGVYVPIDSGLALTPDGVLSIADGSVTLPAGSVGTDQIEDGAVTNLKIADSAITEEKLAAGLRETVESAQAYSQGGTSEIKLTRLNGTESTLNARRWGNMVLFDLSGLEFTLSGSANSVDLCSFQDSSEAPAGSISEFYQGAAPVLRSGTSSGMCALSYNDSYRRFVLRFSSQLTAGTYTVTGTFAILWV